jgi:hypothetical protein
MTVTPAMAAARLRAAFLFPGLTRLMTFHFRIPSSADPPVVAGFAAGESGFPSRKSCQSAPADEKEGEEGKGVPGEETTAAAAVRPFSGALPL